MFDLLPFRHHRHSVPDLFREMESMMRQMREGFPFLPETGSEFGGEWSPRVDIAETETAIEVKAELPGLEHKDIDISLERDLLVIKGEKQKETEKKEASFHRVERTYGSFFRALRLPVEVETDKVEAVFKNGVLTITLPKSEEGKKKITHIEVH